MTINLTIHKTILFQILKDIYSDTSISPYLGFKGGTAAFMFHGLNRFSVDLDFDILDDNKENYVFDQVIKIVKKYGQLKESYKKRFNLFCLLSYEEKSHNIKIEINRRQFGSKYEIRNYLGVPMQVMVKEDMFAHKLMAMYERMSKTSRDIYDVWFFLNKHFPINEQIVENRAKTTFKQLLKKCISKLEKFNNKKILDGVGELLNSNQKDWAKEKLLYETIALLKLRLPN